MRGEVPGLDVAVLEVPERWSDGAFDPVVLRKVLYCLEPSEIDALAVRVVGALEPGGHRVSVCWTGENDSTAMALPSGFLQAPGTPLRARRSTGCSLAASRATGSTCSNGAERAVRSAFAHQRPEPDDHERLSGDKQDETARQTG